LCNTVEKLGNPVSNSLELFFSSLVNIFMLSCLSSLFCELLRDSIDWLIDYHASSTICVYASWPIYHRFLLPKNCSSCYSYILIYSSIQFLAASVFNKFSSVQCLGPLQRTCGAYRRSTFQCSHPSLASGFERLSINENPSHSHGVGCHLPYGINTHWTLNLLITLATEELNIWIQWIQQHSVTSHTAQVNTPHSHAREASTWFTYPWGMEGWVDLGELLQFFYRACPKQAR